MYSFRGYNPKGRDIKPSIDRPAKVEVPKIRNPSLGTIGLRTNNRARKAIEIVEKIEAIKLPKPLRIKSGSTIKKYISPTKVFIRTRSIVKTDRIKVQQMIDRGLTYGKIAAVLGLTRNQVAGICYRWLGLK